MELNHKYIDRFKYNLNLNLDVKKNLLIQLWYLLIYNWFTVLIEI